VGTVAGDTAINGSNLWGFSIRFGVLDGNGEGVDAAI